MPFRFQSEKAHFTYKTHIDEPRLKALMLSKGEIKIYSFVHEIRDENEESPTPYELTHVFVWWKSSLNLTDPRTFDIDQIHPNLRNRACLWRANTPNSSLPAAGHHHHSKNPGTF